MENLKKLSKNKDQQIFRETRITILNESEQYFRIMRKNYQDGSITIEHRVQMNMPTISRHRG